MRRIIIAGIGTDVGKTVVSTILTQLLDAAYWKPVQTGEEDSARVAELLGPSGRIIPSIYSFKIPTSPHRAASLESKTIDPAIIQLPKGQTSLVIESAGGILVPITYKQTTFDVFQSWAASWIIVSRHYLGSINHTLMTLEILKNRGITPLGIIFNGEHACENERAILNISGLSCLARLEPENEITPITIHKYVQQWQHLKTILN